MKIAEDQASEQRRTRQQDGEAPVNRVLGQPESDQTSNRYQREKERIKQLPRYLKKLNDLFYAKASAREIFFDKLDQKKQEIEHRLGKLRMPGKIHSRSHINGKSARVLNFGPTNESVQKNMNFNKSDFKIEEPGKNSFQIGSFLQPNKSPRKKSAQEIKEEEDEADKLFHFKTKKHVG